jgi:hypothetical protein
MSTETKTKKPKPNAAKKPSTSMVIIHEEQYDKFATVIEPFDYLEQEFNIFIQVEILAKRSASRYWLKHLRDLYAKVKLVDQLLFILNNKHFWYL